jgi:hypothetical protein
MILKLALVLLSGPFFAPKINNNLNSYNSTMDTPIFIGHGQVKNHRYVFIDDDMAMVTSHDYNTDQWQFRQTSEHTSNVGLAMLFRKCRKKIKLF